MKQILLSVALLLSASATFACPNGQRDVCVVPRVWGHGCAQSACVPIPGWVPPIPTFTVGGVSYQARAYAPDNDKVKRFGICINMPSDEAAACLGMFMGCAPAAAAAGVGYPVCVVASCGAAGATQIARCVRQVGIDQ